MFLCCSKKPRVSFPPALSEVFCTSQQTLSTSSFASLDVTFCADVPFSRIQKGSTETRDPGSGDGITETERETEAEYAILERRFQAIESKIKSIYIY